MHVLFQALQFSLNFKVIDCSIFEKNMLHHSQKFVVGVGVGGGISGTPTVPKVVRRLIFICM
jgi:hypothetical protein